MINIGDWKILRQFSWLQKKRMIREVSRFKYPAKVHGIRLNLKQENLIPAYFQFGVELSQTLGVPLICSMPHKWNGRFVVPKECTTIFNRYLLEGFNWTKVTATQINEPFHQGMTPDQCYELFEWWSRLTNVYVWCVNLPLFKLPDWEKWEEFNWPKDKAFFEKHFYDKGRAHIEKCFVSWSGKEICTEANIWPRTLNGNLDVRVLWTRQNILRVARHVLLMASLTGDLCWHPLVHGTRWGLYSPKFGKHPIVKMFKSGFERLKENA